MGNICIGFNVLVMLLRWFSCVRLVWVIMMVLRLLLFILFNLVFRLFCRGWIFKLRFNVLSCVVCCGEDVFINDLIGNFFSVSLLWVIIVLWGLLCGGIVVIVNFGLVVVGKFLYECIVVLMRFVFIVLCNVVVKMLILRLVIGVMDWLFLVLMVINFVEWLLVMRVFLIVVV